MARKPFDPSLAHGALFRSIDDDGGTATPGKGSTPAGEEPWTVAALAARIKEALRAGIPGPFVVRGELGRISRTTHLYSTLCQANATVGLVMWDRTCASLRFEPKEGQAVIVRGRVEFYPPHGKLRVIAESMEPAGQGDLDAMRERLRQQFRALGWFDPARKRPLPRVPRHVALVTSEGAAALHDVARVHAERGRWCRLTLFPTLVQGAQAASMIAAAIDRANAAALDPPLECLLLVRGGGSKEDLWAFNEAPVVEAIVRSRLPVVTGIGHEIDESLADLAADAAAATPTLAAATVLPDREAMREELAARASDLARAMQDVITDCTRTIERIIARPVLQSPTAALVPARARLDGWMRSVQLAATTTVGKAARELDGIQATLARLEPRARVARLRSTVDTLAVRCNALAERRVGKASTLLDTTAGTLEALSPLGVLDRGYSITLGPSGQPVRRVRDAAPGTELTTLLADGRIGSTVTTHATEEP